MAVASNPLETFIWGAGGQKMSPEQVARQREIAAALMQGGMDYSPVDHWLQGAARASQGLVGGLKERWAGEAEQRGREGFQSQWDSVFGGGAASPVAAALASDGAGGGDFMDALINSESGGNWNALNSEGYGGRLQFGDARLADAARAGIIPAGVTGAAFSQMSPEQQQAVEAWHFNDIDQQAERLGINKYLGQTIAGVPINQNSIRSMAHLGGIGGVKKFVESGGQYNPSDSNGTSLSNYGTRFGGMSGGGAPTQVAQAGGGQGVGNPSVAQLLSLAGNEWANPGQSSVVSALLGQAMQQQDPRYQQQLALGDLDMQRAQLELDALRNPAAPAPVFEGGQWWDLSGGAPNALTDRAVDPTAGIQNYDYLIAQGLSPEDAAARAFSGGVTIKMPGQPNIGSIPAGYSATQDEDGSWSMAPIPGGPAAAEAAAAEEQARLRRENIARAGGTVVQDIGRALQILEGDNPLAAGAGALIGQFIPEGDTQTLQGFYNSVLGNVGFDQLQAMREASPTGGALGNVNKTELDFLQGILGRLDVTSRPEVQADNLKRINNIYMDRIHGTPEQIMRAYQNGDINPQTGQPLTLQDIEPLIFRYELSFDEMGRPINRSAPQSQGTIPQSNQTSSGVTWSFVD